MKTTLKIDDTVTQRLREEATRRGTTMSALVEAGLRRIPDQGADADPAPRSIPPLPTWHGSETLVDVSNRDDLYELTKEA